MTAYSTQPGHAFDTGIEFGRVRWLADLRRAWARRRAYVATRDELDALTDRDLSDLGISRLSIRDIAREAAYGH